VSEGLKRVALIGAIVLAAGAAWGSDLSPLAQAPAASPSAAALSLSPAATATAPPMPCLGDFLSTSMTAFYRGEGGSQIQDYSGCGHPLSMLGCPLAVTDVAAPVGDSWLFGSLDRDATTPDDYFRAPTSIVPTADGIFTGCIAWYLYYGGPGHVRSPIFRVEDAEAVPHLLFEVGMTRPVFVLEWLSPTGPGSLIPYHAMVPGHTYIIRIECRSDTVNLSIDGRSLGCISKPVFLDHPDKVYIGRRPGLEYGVWNFFVDGLMVSTDPDEPFPPKKR
jgi:hypothetical protein